MDPFIITPKAPLLLSQVAKRKDVSPDAGESKYGDVKFADEKNKKYPLDTQAHAKAALSYINMPKNAAKYSSKDLKTIKSKIMTACKDFGIDVATKQSWTREDLGLDPEIPLTQEHFSVSGTLVQDHNNIEGSLGELMSNIQYAFREWRKGAESYDYRWTNILGIKDNKIIFYSEDWSCAPCYYSVGYTVGEGQSVAIDNNVNSVDVALVVKELGIDAEEMGEQSMETMKPTETQDAVPEGTPIASEAASATGVETSADNPKVPKKATDADGAGTTVIDPAAEAETTEGPEKSNEIPAGPAAATGSTGAVKTEMAKEAEGKKQSAPQDEDHLLQGDNYDQAKQPLSYIQSAKAEEVDGKKLMRLQAIVTRGNIVNSKGEVYPTTVWQSNLDLMNEKCTAGKFIGKTEHPATEQGLVDASLKFDKFWLQGDDVWADITVIPTENGKNLQAMIEAGVQIDFSSRGYGSKVTQDWRGVERPVIQDDFVCSAFDAVWYGASTGSGVKDVHYQDHNKQGAENVDKDTQVQSADERAAGIRAEDNLVQTRDALIRKAGTQLEELGVAAYSKALVECQSVGDLMTKHDLIMPIMQSTFPKAEAGAAEQTQAATYSPTFFNKQTPEELAPQNVGEMFDRLVADLPDKYEGRTYEQGAQPNVSIKSPRAACKQLLCNIARLQQGSFHGGNAARGLLALEQGKIDRAQDILLQSLPTGATVATGNADGDGAPLSNYLIFPLIRRVFPRYIMNEIASIQPMDRPDGKIFYLDSYRVDSNAAESRIDVNTSASPFNSSFANNATEGAAARQIRMRLASVQVSAHTKKLGAAWSIEEMQDLRAYHGLDASQELLGSVAREMALEWNQEVLDDMIAQATASSRTFNKTMPSAGWVQKDWDAYIWTYIQAMDNDIFGKRQGPMTHLVVGIDAALALAKSARAVFDIGGENGGDMNEFYPGLSFYGLTAPNGSKYKVIKTNFWPTGTTNGSKIMGLRRGPEWSDTPYIWAPYADYVTPQLTDPSDFSQKQGILSRAAKKVVVPEAMGYLTVASGVGSEL
jgi:hypothetical protein